MEFRGNERFEVLEKLGEGGMGVVYAVYDRSRDMRVALKRLRHVSANSLYRFKREFRALRNLSHPNIVDLYELISEGDDWFLTMELVEGADFITYVRNGRVPPAPRRPTGTYSDTAALNTAETRTGQFGLLDDTPSPELEGLPEPPEVKAEISTVVDLDRLRHTLGQLAHALSALHAAKLVHRDLKPANVRVTADGRIVLMDFGIVAEHNEGIPSAGNEAMIGTPSFMAPEQVRGEVPTAAADWYAFGVMMYLALTGYLPYVGPNELVMNAKLKHAPLEIGGLVEGAPANLSRLCMQLLAHDVTRRPSGTAVLYRLGAARATTVPDHEWVTAEIRTDTFVGRSRELSELHMSYAAARRGAIRCVLIQGPSGMGKTMLVERFLSQLGEREPDALVLAGRCHERESLAYKAFDGIIDQLSRHLAAMSPAARASLVSSAELALIARLFPVLGQAQQSGPVRTDAALLDDGREAMAQRFQAVTALRALLTRLVRERPLILRIEDLQWADRDSLSLLRDLLRPPRPRGLLLIATLRLEDLDTPASRHVRDVITWLEDHDLCQRLELGPLSQAEQRQLLKSTVRQSAVLQHIDDALLQEATGHPMLLAELARYAQEAPAEILSRQSLHVKDVIWRRVTLLPKGARALMEAIAIAGEPVPLSLVAQAIHLTDSERERVSSLCCISQLARIMATDDDGTAWISTYHEMVREAIVDRLPGDQAVLLHRRLAEALQGWERTPVAMLARHWLASGDFVQAASYLYKAAVSASEQLAVGRAAELYRMALEIMDFLPARADESLDLMRCRACIGLAEGMRLVDNTDKALDLLDRAQELARLRCLLEEEAMIHYLRGNLLFPLGEFDRSMAEHERSLALAREIRSPEREALALSGLGDTCYMRGRMKVAWQHYEQSIEIAREHGLVGIEVATLAMHGLTRYYHGDLAAALRDSRAAAALAADIGHERAELVARGFCGGWVLFEMHRMDEARAEFERALELARDLGARRFEPAALAFLARLAAAQGLRHDAVAIAERSVAIAREAGPAFMGPVALVTLALVTEDSQKRRAALEEGRAILARTSMSHCALYFYRDAMEVALAEGDAAAVEAYAASLEAFTAEEPLPWSTFFVARGRELARGLLGKPNRAVLQQLVLQASQQGFYRAAVALERALQSTARETRIEI